MSKDPKQVPTMLQEIQRVRLSRTLPRVCPNCLFHLAWGWMEEDFASPLDCEIPGDEIRIQRIPRPDQTLFCPGCEARILN